MSLQIILGRSGTGKTTYIFNEISRKLKVKSQKKIYIITPEQFSFTAEKQLLDVSKEEAVFKAEVLTFNRMAYRVIQEKRRAVANVLSPCGKSMLLYNILSNNKDGLNFIGKSIENVDLVSKQITEFKKHAITVETLKNVLEQTEDTYLKAKIMDMLIVYEEYNKQISENFIDENDSLDILAQNLEQIPDFKDCSIYIDEFIGFTKQEFEVLRLLMRNGNDVCITMCSDEMLESLSPDADIFYANKQTLSRILEIARQEGVVVKEPICLKNNYRFKNEELKHLEKNLYAVPYKKYDKNIDKIKLLLAGTKYAEIESVGEKIIELVRDEGYRYNDISIITKDLEGYVSLCKAIFNKYDIPVFIDEKKDLSQNILVRYLLAILNIFAKNWSSEAVFEYIKTNFLPIDKMDVHVLENYCLKWGVKGNKWYLGDWNFYDETEEEQTKILHMRDLVILPLLEFKKKLSRQKTVEEITKALYEFLQENDISQKLEEIILDLQQNGAIEIAKEYETSWKLVMSVFDEIVRVLGKQVVSFEKYSEILKMGLANSKLGKIPALQDQVIVGNVDRSRSHKVKVVFIIGLNDGSFPSNNKDEGFFNDDDREILKKEGAELAKGTLEKLYDDNFNIYKAFSTAEEKLYLSYVSSDFEGRQLRPSILVNKVKKIFPKLQEKSIVVDSMEEKPIVNEERSFENLLEMLRKKKDEELPEELNRQCAILYEYFCASKKWSNKLKACMEALNYTNQPEKISKEIISKLYGDTLKTSVSRLEQYQACPFSYYLKYGLNLSDKSKFKIEAIDTGTFMHDVIDGVFDKVEERDLKIKEIEDDLIQELVDEIIEEKLQLKKNYIFTSIPKYRMLASRLKRVIKQSMKYIIDSLKYSKFDMLGHEFEFKEGKEYKPIEITLDNGKKVEITGKIDRIDIAKTAQGDYIRIIDYKSSVKDMNLNEVKAGLQLQLLTYLDAVCRIDDLLPAGILYFNLIDSMVKANAHLTEEEIEFEIRKQFKMKGFILADVEIVKMMDTRLEKGSSDIIPAYMDKDGNLSKKSSSITRKQFESLQAYTKKMIKQISTAILEGDITVKPYYKMKNNSTPCDYCKYHTICQFNNGICKNSYNYIYNRNKEVVLEEITKK